MVKESLPTSIPKVLMLASLFWEGRGLAFLSLSSSSTWAFTNLLRVGRPVIDSFVGFVMTSSGFPLQG